MARTKSAAATRTPIAKPPAAPPPPKRPVRAVPPAKPEAAPKAKPATPTKPSAPAKNPTVKVRGEAKLLPLAGVKPNDWNPNVMTEFQKQSLRQGLIEDGWVASQPLLVWGKDDKGKQQNVIIDGEHRWTEAVTLGMTEGPMVVLNGLTAAQAKALTVKLDAKRGKFDPAKLGALLLSIEAHFDSGISSLSFGFTDDELAKFMAPPDVNSMLTGAGNGAGGGGGLGGTITSENSLVKMVPLYFDGPRHEAFIAAVKKLSERHNLENVTDVVERVVTEAAAAQ